MSATEDSPPIGTLAYLDWRYGFMDLKFGQRMEDCPSLRMLEQLRSWDGDVSTPEAREGIFPQGRQLGRFCLSEFRLSFIKNKLCKFNFEVDRYSRAAFREVLKDAYGQPSLKPGSYPSAAGEASETDDHTCFWKGARVYAEYSQWHYSEGALEIMRKCNRVPEQKYVGSFITYSISLHDELLSYYKEQNKLPRVPRPNEEAKLL